MLFVNSNHNAYELRMSEIFKWSVGCLTSWSIVIFRPFFSSSSPFEAVPTISAFISSIKNACFQSTCFYYFGLPRKEVHCSLFVMTQVSIANDNLIFISGVLLSDILYHTSPQNDTVAPHELGTVFSKPLSDIDFHHFMTVIHPSYNCQKRPH